MSGSNIKRHSFENSPISFNKIIDRVVQYMITSGKSNEINHIYFSCGGGEDGLLNFIFSLSILKEYKKINNKTKWCFTCLTGCNTDPAYENMDNPEKNHWYNNFNLIFNKDTNELDFDPKSNLYNIIYNLYKIEYDEFKLLKTDFYNNNNQAKFLFDILTNYHNKLNENNYNLNTNIIIETGWNSMMGMNEYYTSNVQDNAFIMELMNNLHDNKQRTFIIQGNCSIEPQYYFPEELHKSKLDINNFNNFDKKIKESLPILTDENINNYELYYLITKIAYDNNNNFKTNIILKKLIDEMNIENPKLIFIYSQLSDKNFDIYRRSLYNNFKNNNVDKSWSKFIAEWIKLRSGIIEKKTLYNKEKTKKLNEFPLLLIKNTIVIDSNDKKYTTNKKSIFNIENIHPLSNKNNDKYHDEFIKLLESHYIILKVYHLLNDNSIKIYQLEKFIINDKLLNFNIIFRLLNRITQMNVLFHTMNQKTSQLLTYMLTIYCETFFKYRISNVTNDINWDLAFKEILNKINDVFNHQNNLDDNKIDIDNLNLRAVYIKNFLNEYLNNSISLFNHKKYIDNNTVNNFNSSVLKESCKLFLEKGQQEYKKNNNYDIIFTILKFTNNSEPQSQQFSALLFYFYLFAILKDKTKSVGRQFQR